MAGDKYRMLIVRPKLLRDRESLDISGNERAPGPKIDRADIAIRIAEQVGRERNALKKEVFDRKQVVGPKKPSVSRVIGTNTT